MIYGKESDVTFVLGMRPEGESSYEDESRVETKINKPTAIELGDQVIVMAVDRIIEPSLQAFEMVAGDVAELLAESKSIIYETKQANHYDILIR